MVAALGGGPVLVRNSKPVFRSLEDFTNDQVTQRDARAGVGQLADGRIVLVAVDGRQPGYSVGLTSFELAQTLQRLGAVSASAVDPGASVTVAFDGQLLNKPSDPGGERPVKEALLVQYFGVFAPQPPAAIAERRPGPRGRAARLQDRPAVEGDGAADRPGQRAARARGGASRKQPGSYPFTFTNYDVEGTWHWNVQAIDDLGRTSTIDRTFRYDTTLKGLSAPQLARGRATFRFTLARAAKVRLQIETKTGIVMRSQAPIALPAGAQSVVWDGRLPLGTKAYSGTYVGHVFATSSVGTSDLALQFAFRRG